MKWNDDLPWDSWYEWKAHTLNQLFLEQGLTGRPGRITAASIKHGERHMPSPARSEVEGLPQDPRNPGHHINPATGIWPMCEWGPECRRGYVEPDKNHDQKNSRESIRDQAKPQDGRS